MKFLTKMVSDTKQKSRENEVLATKEDTPENVRGASVRVVFLA